MNTIALRLLGAVLASTLPTMATLANDSTAGVELNEPAPMGLGTELRNGLYSRLYLLYYSTHQHLKEAPLNPDNFLDLPGTQAALNARLDLHLDFRRWALSIRPRVDGMRNKWDLGPMAGTSDTQSSMYINEWFLRYRPVDSLSISGGRENLQWGPSVILSTSNPFNRNNGRNNPQLELPGLEFVRAVWIPNAQWSLSAIANTGLGHIKPAALGASNQPTGSATLTPDVPTSKFTKTYALKLDYTGSATYFSLIPSSRRGDRTRYGFFGGWHLSDAWHVYAEGSDASGGFQGQTGASYTLRSGPTLGVEYLRNNGGCRDLPLLACFETGAVKSTDSLYRRNYLMMQISDNTTFRDLDLVFRITHNQNDHSNRLSLILDYGVDDNAELYLIANRYHGDTESEFGSLLRYSVFAGIGYTF